MVKQLVGFHGAERRGGDLVGREQKDRVRGGGERLLDWEKEEKKDEEREEEEKAASAQVVSRKPKAIERRKEENELDDNKMVKNSLWVKPIDSHCLRPKSSKGRTRGKNSQSERVKPSHHTTTHTSRDTFCIKVQNVGVCRRDK